MKARISYLMRIDLLSCLCSPALLIKVLVPLETNNQFKCIIFHASEQCGKHALYASPVLILEEEIVYDFEISTGKQSLSGTDATVYIQLFGSKGKSNIFTFDDKKREFFESGATDVFRVSWAHNGRKGRNLQFPVIRHFS